jgi:hypothetical protein
MKAPPLKNRPLSIKRRLISLPLLSLSKIKRRKREPIMLFLKLLMPTEDLRPLPSKPMSEPVNSRHSELRQLSHRPPLLVSKLLSQMLPGLRPKELKPMKALVLPVIICLI